MAAIPRASLPASGNVWQHCVFQASSPDASKTFEDAGTSAPPPNNFALDQGVPREAAHDVWQSGWMGDRYLKPKPFAAGRIRRDSDGERYAHRLHRRRPGRALFRPADEEGKPGSPRHGRRAKPAVRYLRLGRRFLRCDHGEYARLGHQDRESDREPRSTIGTTSRSGSKADACAPPATVLSASAARNCSTFCRNAAKSSEWSSCSSARSTSTLNFPTPT